MMQPDFIKSECGLILPSILQKVLRSLNLNSTSFFKQFSNAAFYERHISVDFDMSYIFQLNSKNKRSSYRKLVLSSICMLPLIALATTPAHAQLVNNATVTGTPDAGTLTDAMATESVDIISQIISVDDSASGINGTDGATGVIDVFANDTLNGSPVNPADVTLTETVADPTGALTLNADGSVDVAPGTPAGTYELTYEICETLNPTNCTTSTVTVEVDPAPITAVSETFTGINGTDGGVTGSVLDSDTLNGSPVDIADVTITVGASDPELSLDPVTGLITVAAGTPAGTYTCLLYTSPSPRDRG